jgi:hypothetical protein
MPELWANLGLMQQEAGDIPGSNRQLSTGQPSQPVSCMFPIFSRHRLSLRTGRAREAIPFLTKAEKINKTDPQTPLALGRAYFAVGKFHPSGSGICARNRARPQARRRLVHLGIARLNQVEVDARKMSGRQKIRRLPGRSMPSRWKSRAIQRGRDSLPELA